MKRICFGFLFSLFLISSPGSASDPQLVGVWKTLKYQIQGEDYPLDGLFIFTGRHFSANVFFRLSGGELDDMNANAGTYRTSGEKMVFMQQIQSHIRPGDEKEPIFYGKGVEEVASYRVEKDRLLIIFPSGNRYVCERIE